MCTYGSRRPRRLTDVRTRVYPLQLDHICRKLAQVRTLATPAGDSQ
jgi:hypothetical protein